MSRPSYLHFSGGSQRYVNLPEVVWQADGGARGKPWVKVRAHYAFLLECNRLMRREVSVRTTDQGLLSGC